MKGEVTMISLIIPCYNEEQTLPAFYEALNRVAAEIPEHEFEFLFVNDGSCDRTLDLLKALAERDARVVYFSFSRNFGKEAAMYAGICNVKGDYAAVIDADLQDPPELLKDMLACLKTGEYDCVAARRVSRKGEPPVRSMFARLFYKIINRISDIDVVDGARDFRLMKREIADVLAAMGERNRFSKGIFGWVGYRTCWLPYENVERAAGETKWSFWKLFRYSLDGIISFSQVPLSLASYCGFVFTFLSFLAICFIMIRKWIYGDPVPGWPSLACIITFIGGVQLFCMGIIGQYLAKTYMEVKKRPHYIISESNRKDVRKVQ